MNDWLKIVEENKAKQEFIIAWIKWICFVDWNGESKHITNSRLTNSKHAKEEENKKQIPSITR